MNSEKPPCWQPMSEPLLLKLINEPGIVRLILKMAFPIVVGRQLPTMLRTRKSCPHLLSFEDYFD